MPVRSEPGNATMRIKRKVHPDKNENAYFRMHHAVLACLVMVDICMAVVRGEELMNIHVIPQMLLTPFEPDNARTSPSPSLSYALIK